MVGAGLGTACLGIFFQLSALTFCSKAIVEQRPIDYCATGLHDCDIPQRATCIYTGGSSYTCSCLPGFSGDGRACQGMWSLLDFPCVTWKVLLGDTYHDQFPATPHPQPPNIRKNYGPGTIGEMNCFLHRNCNFFWGWSW